MKLLWPDKIECQNVLLMVSESSHIMANVANNLKRTLFPKLIHVTFVCHAMQKVMKTIATIYPKINLLIFLLRKLFMNPSNEMQTINECYPFLAASPKNFKYWSTWMQTAVWVGENYGMVCDKLKILDEEKSTTVILQSILNEDDEKFLAYIRENFQFMLDDTNTWKLQNLSVEDVFKIVNKISDSLKNAEGVEMGKVAADFALTLSTNAGLKELLRMIENSNSNSRESDGAVSDGICYKFAPITSCLDKESLDEMSRLLRWKQTCLMFEHLLRRCIVVCNK